MKLFILRLRRPGEFYRLRKILEQNGINYEVLVITITDKTETIGGIISGYDVERISLTDALVKALENVSWR